MRKAYSLRNWGLRAGLVALVGIGCGSCDRLAQTGIPVPALPFPLFVSRVENLQNPASAGRTVYLRGQVGDRVPLLTGEVYQLQDETGTIWVVSNDTMLQQGEEVLIRGTVRYENIPLAGQEFGEAYIEEQDKLERRSVQPSPNL